MQIGLTTGVAVYEGVNYEDAIDHIMWQARFADEAGFKRLWMVEHHFTSFAMTGAPSTILSHYAALTKRIKIGYAVAVLPLHHPVRLAEEIVWLDNLSKGRLMVGIGPGSSALEYGVYGVDLQRKREYVEEGLEILRKALSGRPFSHTGEFWKIPEVQIQPPPYRPGGPPIYMATSSHDSVAKAAQWDVIPLLGFRPLDALKEQITLYRRMREEMGDEKETIDRKQKEIGVLRRVVVGDTEEEAWEDTQRGSVQFAEAVQGLGIGTGASRPGTVTVLTAQGTKIQVEMTPEEQQKMSRENALKGSIFGTKDQVIEQLRDLEATGVGHVLAGFGGRGMPLEKVRHKLDVVAKEILPLFND